MLPLFMLVSEEKEIAMQQHDIKVRVFLVPGGEEASLWAYEQLVNFLATHDDVCLSIYRGPNRSDGTWSLVLIGEKTSFSRYEKQIQQPLSEVQALPITVSPESLTSLMEKFLATQAAMLLNKETFVEKHYPLSKKYYAKKKTEVRKLKRWKKRH